jgi:hypothetical protein
MSFWFLAAATAACIIDSIPFAAAGADDEGSPIYGVKIPAGYRDWALVNVAHEAGDLKDLRVVLGNDVAMKAFRDRTLPLPDGAIIARLAWKMVPSPENNAVLGRSQSFVTGAPTNLEFMVKDSKRYAMTGGLGIRAIHRRQTRRRGGAQNMLLLPRARENARFDLYALRTLKVEQGRR